MSDLIFVSTEEFARLKRDNAGVYLKDSVDAEMIVLEDCIIRIFNLPVPPEEEEEVIEEVVE